MISRASRRRVSGWQVELFCFARTFDMHVNSNSNSVCYCRLRRPERGSAVVRKAASSVSREMARRLMALGIGLSLAESLIMSNSAAPSRPRRMAPPSPSLSKPKQYYALRTSDGATSVVDDACCAIEMRLPKELTDLAEYPQR